MPRANMNTPTRYEDAVSIASAIVTNVRSACERCPKGTAVAALSLALGRLCALEGCDLAAACELALMSHEASRVDR